jgi:polysaccharide biosynthesis/export protein
MQNSYSYLGGILILALLSGCMSSNVVQERDARDFATTGISPQMVDSLYRIGPGDEVDILVWEQPGFNTTTTVSTMGTIVVPLVGELTVSGLTRDQLERELKRELSEYIRDEIILTISIRNTAHMTVSVFGMVARSDNYPIIDETPIFKVLSMAGGPVENADIRRVKIYRKNSNPHTETLDLTTYLDSGMNDSMAMIHPGDVIYVPRKENAVREMSDFLRDVVLLFGIFRIVN